jgi:hypothetical protein
MISLLKWVYHMTSIYFDSTVQTWHLNPVKEENFLIK